MCSLYRATSNQSPIEEKTEKTKLTGPIETGSNQWTGGSHSGDTIIILPRRFDIGDFPLPYFFIRTNLDYESERQMAIVYVQRGETFLITNVFVSGFKRYILCDLDLPLDDVAIDDLSTLITKGSMADWDLQNSEDSFAIDPVISQAWERRMLCDILTIRQPFECMSWKSFLASYGKDGPNHAEFALHGFKTPTSMPMYVASKTRRLMRWYSTPEGERCVYQRKKDKKQASYVTSLMIVEATLTSGKTVLRANLDESVSNKCIQLGILADEGTPPISLNSNIDYSGLADELSHVYLKVQDGEKSEPRPRANQTRGRPMRGNLRGRNKN
jgi:hypothetical protein